MWAGFLIDPAPVTAARLPLLERSLEVDEEWRLPADAAEGYFYLAAEHFEQLG